MTIRDINKLDPAVTYYFYYETEDGTYEIGRGHYDGEGAIQCEDRTFYIGMTINSYEYLPRNGVVRVWF